MKALAIIMAGGSGSRTGSSIPKQFMDLGDRCILEMTMEAFQSHRQIDSIYIVCKKEYLDHTRELVRIKKFDKVEKLIPGGETRQLSVMNGVFASENDQEKILVHDSARPYVTRFLIDIVLSALDRFDAVTPVIDSADTLISTRTDRTILNFPDRKTIKRAQTPQGFRREIILNAHRSAERDNRFDFTDDCSMVFHYKLGDIITVEGEAGNIKITSSDDLARLKRSINGVNNDHQV